MMPRDTASRALAAVGLLACILISTPASAYTRYLSKTGCPYSWRSRSIPIRVFPEDIATLTPEQIVSATALAVGAWGKNDAILGACTDLDLSLTTVSQVSPPAKYDHRNNVIFRTDSWCSATSVGSPDCRDPSALAITSVFAKTWGEIVDADIEVNAFGFRWGDLEASPLSTGSMQDLQNALTHEVGHLIGLDHSCYGDFTRPRPNDQNGQPIPDCSTAPPSVRATTMFASADPGDTSKRTLEVDDQQAVCDIYPLASPSDPGACVAPDTGGCGVGPDSSTAGFWTKGAGGWAGATALALLFATIAGRRARRR